MVKVDMVRDGSEIHWHECVRRVAVRADVDAAHAAAGGRGQIQQPPRAEGRRRLHRGAGRHALQVSCLTHGTAPFVCPGSRRIPGPSADCLVNTLSHML